MDTRKKIVSIDSIRESIYHDGDKPKIVIGYFDPMYAANVARLTQIGRVIAIVADRPNAILPLRARAELLASLECVERVVACEGDPVTLVAKFGVADIFDEREADKRRAMELTAHIIERYK